MVRLLSFFFLAACSVEVFGQSTDCEQTLNQATVEFDAGRFYGLPAILKPCLDNGFSKEQKVRAYLLLTQSYLILNDPIAAESSYLELLKADPEYIANPTRDPVDIFYLSKKFTTTPVFTPSFRAGINASLQRTIYTTNTNATPTNTENSFRIGFQVGGALDWNLNERWSICMGLGYAFRSFQTDSYNADASDQKIFIEKQDWVDIPIYVKYARDTGTIRPFVYIGLAANLLLNAKLSAEATDFNSPSQGVRQVSQGPDVPLSYKRNFFNRSAIVGGGVKYKVGKNFLFADVRYMAGLNDLTKNTYTDSNGQLDKLLTNYQYGSDLFRLDNLSFTIGYIKPLYDPRKRKPAVTGFLQKLGLKKGGKK